jgi:pimeloyl-ACP methyl ester carboxylesterase
MTESTTALGAIGSPPGHYAPINGLRLYYEVRGQGRPLVLLHGGLLTIDLAFGPLIPALAERHQVIGVELQGHGHTGDIDRPMRLDSLADDVASLLEHLNLDRADVFGFSLGGMVALTMGLRHPDRIGRLVIASVDHRPNHAEFEQPDDPDVARRMPTEADFQGMREAHARVAPRPEDFDAVAEKTSSMVHAFGGWSDSQLGSISAPTLLLVGDTDFVPLENAVAMFKLLPGAELAVLPGTTHIGVTRNADRVLATVRPFLEPAG